LVLRIADQSSLLAAARISPQLARLGGSLGEREASGDSDRPEQFE